MPENHAAFLEFRSKPTRTQSGNDFCDRWVEPRDKPHPASRRITPSRPQQLGDFLHGHEFSDDGQEPLAPGGGVNHGEHNALDAGVSRGPQHTQCAPMNPDPPVTSTIAPLMSTRFSFLHACELARCATYQPLPTG